MKVVAALVIAMLGGCTSPGTIEVHLDLEGAKACGTGQLDAVVYAAPKTSCELCDCGACFGRGKVVACGDQPCDLAALEHGVALDLPSGPAAIVFELYANGTLIASQCADLDLSTDGTDDATVQPGREMCCPVTGSPP